ncbi:MAG: hypothetical protein K0S65_4467 [Labilithrix sp.]|nr:hypothetical protein [Labilithrix sp.]
MTKLPEVELAAVRKIAPDELRLLWVNDWYDRPLEAVIEHEGATCLMVLHQKDVLPEAPYRWLIVKLTAEQLAEEERWHALYVERVGDHWCFHGPDHVAPVDAGSEDPFVAYRRRPEREVPVDDVVGWADEMPAH